MYQKFKNCTHCAWSVWLKEQNKEKAVNKDKWTIVQKKAST